MPRGESRRSRTDRRRKPIRSAVWAATPSQQATVKYFWVVSALILVQMLLGVVTAHYGVEGDGFYGFPLSKWLPYSVTRTWHVQIGPVLDCHGLAGSRAVHRPAGQRAGTEGTTPGRQRPVPGAAVVVVGSLTGEWLSIHNKMSDTVSFYFGHQGYEYVDLGRAWQIALFVGLLLWLFLMIRVLLPGLAKSRANRSSLWRCWPSPRPPSPCSTVRA